MQVFTDNMSQKGEPKIGSCKASENWTCVTFKPDLAKFSMSELEEDTIALMRKRVYDMAGLLGRTVKVGWQSCPAQSPSAQPSGTAHLNLTGRHVLHCHNLRPRLSAAPHLVTAAMAVSSLHCNHQRLHVHLCTGAMAA